MGFRILRRAVLGCALALSIETAAAQECGSLMTYRQFSVYVSKAPECYRNGCGSAPISSMSSECPQPAPCRALWELMYDDQRNNYCATCGDDIACRIPGWPVMNATEVCNTMPQYWIFDTDGECCTASGDAIPITRWVSSMCNGSEWRQPFEYYGGMAQQDWAEWIEPWNWTFTKQNSTVPVPCATRGVALSLIWVENLFEIAAILVILLGFIVFVRIGEWDPRQLFDPLSKEKVAQAGGGATNGVFWILSGVFGAFSQHYAPGYASLPIGDFFILYCTRPSLNGLNFALFYLVRRYIKAKTPEQERRAQVRAANLLLGFGYSEWIQQVFGLPILGIVALAGTKKGFYRPGALSPYWQGFPALVMYVGALLGITFSVFCLIAVTYFLIEYEGTQRRHRMVQTKDKVYGPFKEELEEREWQLNEDKSRFREALEQRRRAHEMGLKQEALETAMGAEDVRLRRTREQSKQRRGTMENRQARLNQERQLLYKRNQELASEKEHSERDVRARRDKLDTELGFLDTESTPETAEVSLRRMGIRAGKEALNQEEQKVQRLFEEESSDMNMRNNSIRARQEQLTRDREENLLQSRQESLDERHRHDELCSKKDEIDLELTYSTYLIERDVLQRKKREMDHGPSQNATTRQREIETIRRKQVFLNQQLRHYENYTKQVDLEKVRRESERLTIQEQLTRDRRIWELCMEQTRIDAERAQLESDSLPSAREEAESRLRVRQEVLASKRQEHERQSAEECTAKVTRVAELRAKQEDLDEARRASDQLQQQELESQQELGNSEQLAPQNSETQQENKRHSLRRIIRRYSRGLLFTRSTPKILDIVRKELELIQGRMEEKEQDGWENRVPRPPPRQGLWNLFMTQGRLSRLIYVKKVRACIKHEQKRVATVLLGQVEFEVDEAHVEKAEHRLISALGAYDQDFLRFVQNPTTKKYREKLALLPFGFWFLTYIWRWMFWYGFIYSMGDRWCPPQDYLGAMPGLFGAFISTALGLLSTLISTAPYSNPITGDGNN